MPLMDEIAKAMASSLSVTLRSGQNSPVASTSLSSAQTFTGLGSSSGLMPQ